VKIWKNYKNYTCNIIFYYFWRYSKKYDETKIFKCYRWK